MADDGAAAVELQEEPARQQEKEKEQAPAAFASEEAKARDQEPAVVSNADAGKDADKGRPDGLLPDGVNYSDPHMIPTPWHPGDDEFENDAERWEQIKACGCIPRVVQGRCFEGINGGLRYYVNPIVMTLGILVIWGFVIWCAVDAEGAGEKLGEANLWVTVNLGWFYIVCVAIFGFFSLYLVCTKYGDIVLGPAGEPPKYSYPTWFAMLFSAGVGIGLYFFGVAEAVFHINDSQNGNNRWYHETTNNQALAAMNVTWFHWGFTASATYVVAALPLAYHHHVHNEPIRESVCFIILIGHKYANGILGHMIDLTSVVSTMFGVSTSLGLGVIQINSGLAYAFGVEESVATQMWIIWGITAAATISVLTGVDRGIRRLSEINFNFSLILMFFVFFASDTIFLLNLFIQTIGYHVQYQIQLIFDTASFEQAMFFDTDDPELVANLESHISNQAAWMQWWTPFYWAWWIAWAPFVGIFIAQISRGRTVREFVIGNMMVPTLFTCLWLGIFGGLGLYNELGSIQNGVECDGYWDAQQYTGANSLNISTTMVWQESIESVHNGYKITKLSCYGTPQMMWAALDTLPLSSLTKVLALIGIIIYFVTSSDSASHVIDVLTASGNEDPPMLQRLFWAVSEGAVAAVLLSTGDAALTALQTASLVAAAPFAVVLLCETYATWLTLRLHCGEYRPREYVYWRYDLFSIFEKAGPLKVLAGLVCPPYFHTVTRLKIIEYARNSGHADSDRNDNPADSFGEYKDDEWKYIWIACYWLTWLLVVVFLILEAVGIDGMYELALTAFVFYLGVVLVNRNAVRAYYKIDSSNTCYGCLAWLFCCCFAVVQENMQAEADYGVDLKVGTSDSEQEFKDPDRSHVVSQAAMTTYGNAKGEDED